ncbi:MAG: HD domain-containing phosphohydrolase, partial [Thermodesulfobacteriota bacterium]
WSGIKETSEKIFSIDTPVGNKRAAALALKLDKELGPSLLGSLHEWRNIELNELANSAGALRAAWIVSWKVMTAAALLFLLIGIYISRLLSISLTASIIAVKEMVDDIASGREINPMEARYGKDLEGVATAFNSIRHSLGETRRRLEHSAERYRRLIQTAPDAVLLLDPRGNRIVEANVAAAELTGYSAEELAGLPIDRIHNLCRDGECLGMLKKAAEGKHGKCESATIIRKDKTSVPVVVTSAQVKIEEGELMLCFLRDITERVAREKVREEYTVELEHKVKERTASLEKSLKELGDSKKAVLELLEDVERSKKEWEETFDSIPDAIFIHDSDFRVVKCNMAYQRLAGLPFQDIFERPYYEVYPLMKEPFPLCAREKKRYCRIEEEEISLEKDITYRVRHIPLPDKGGKFTYSLHLMEDISEEKKNHLRIEQEVAVNSQLLRIAEATAKTTNLDLLIKEIVSCVIDILSADMVAAYLVDEESRSFIPSHCEGIERRHMPIFRSEPIDGKSHEIMTALETGKIRVLSTSNNLELKNVFNGNKFIECLDDNATIAVIPITYRNAYLGLIIASYKSSNGVAREIDRRDLSLMSGFANQASVAIDEARLYKESINRTMDLSRKIMTIRMLGEIDRSILSASDSEEIMETSAKMISKLVRCDGADVWTVEDNHLVYSAGDGLCLGKKGYSFETNGTVFSKVINDSMPFAAADLAEMNNPSGIEKNFIDQGLHSIIIMPLTVKYKIKGVLNVCSRSVSAFGSEDLSTLENFSSHIGVALENTRLISDLEGLFLGTVRTLSKTIDAKSPWTHGHSERVTEIAIGIAGVMGFTKEKIKDLELAGLLHDIGKIAIYEDILDKAGKLSEAEYEQIKQHPVKGAEILSPITQLKEIIPGIKYHHVWYDGRGYPDAGIRGRDIHPFARILSVADSVDAMSADRPYRKGRSLDEVVVELKRCSGTQFDPEVVEAFLCTLHNSMSPTV